MFQTEFEFTLPKGYLDGEGNLHRKGVMRLAKAMDEIVPLRDPRVKSNPAYATIIILSRVITRLGVLDDISPAVVEGLYASDLNYLYQLYRRINDLDDITAGSTLPTLDRLDPKEDRSITMTPPPP
ncbi:hypothetical protein [Leptolyngbya sp. CCY15150]|uniref:hypothetical protein n=1 Tax=Leptolyngbya sp. CCY15150 TaxID=2767772 RepID=UPI001EF3D5FD|nr:hypothetical protein [Leptolyngbya sp. CCY15150]